MLFVSLLFSMVQFSSYLKGGTPNLLQAMASVLFLVLWFGYGFVRSGRYKEFIRVAGLFWLCGFILVTLAYYVDGALPFILALIVWPGPLYGLRYFSNMPPDMAFAFFSMFICCGCSLLGVIVGHVQEKLAWREKG